MDIFDMQTALNEILVLIPARGGSKGVVGKNKRVLGNKPLIVYSIDLALSIFNPSQVIVSSDDPEILRIGQDSGATIPFVRPESLSQDVTSTLAVMMHAIDNYKIAGHEFKYLLLLQPTTPFRVKADIISCLQIFLANPSVPLYSVTQIPHKYNPHWVFFDNSNGGLVISSGDENLIRRRQELPPAYVRNGAIYLFEIARLRHFNSLYYGSPSYYLMPDERSINIDSEEDWTLAEERLRMLDII